MEQTEALETMKQDIVELRKEISMLKHAINKTLTVQKGSSSIGP